MGLLDEAIREHLELKRRRGADPTEIERAEKEALGPVRRGPGGRAPTEADLEDEHGWHEDDARALSPDVPAPAPVVAPAPAPAPPPVAPAKPVAAEPVERPPIAAPEQPPRRETVSDATEEWDVEQAFAKEPDKKEAEAAGHEDVLEETPDFLQDTPDHDRLWFEQRPPRDFDFDG